MPKQIMKPRIISIETEITSMTQQTVTKGESVQSVHWVPSIPACGSDPKQSLYLLLFKKISFNSRFYLQFQSFTTVLYYLWVLPQFLGVLISLSTFLEWLRVPPLKEKGRCNSTYKWRFPKTQELPLQKCRCCPRIPMSHSQASQVETQKGHPPD